MKSDAFSSRIGVILAAAGGAVGLGNIWKFPYMLGQNGGGAFLLVYILCVAVFGVPLMMTEFMMGKRSGKSVFSAYESLVNNRHWNWLPFVTFFSTLLITGFYCVVTGWCICYLYYSCVGIFHNIDVNAANALFSGLAQNGWQSFACSAVAVACAAGILWVGVGKGIEQLSKILMPLLLVILLVLIVRVTMLEGAFRGVAFLFASDLSKITPRIILDAMGQCFYSLSIAMGALITYGAYMPKNQNVASTTLQIVVLDTLVAVLAGCAIFPAVFAYGFSPTEGPQLVFCVLPMVFDRMAGGMFFAALFFALLTIAAVTSAMSLIEMQTAFLYDWSRARTERRALAGNTDIPRSLSRHEAISISSLCSLLVAFVCAWSMSDAAPWLTWGGVNAFDWVDRLTSHITLPSIAFFTVLFFGWYVSRDVVVAEMRLYHGVKPWNILAYRFLIRWFIPIIILLIFLNGIGVISL
ncbi:MAG: sodium-dependent transporter [Paludibacteraceae bacterium]|nr:sodium-dependent transporter [Paludibacteraceae bacterium]